MRVVLVALLGFATFTLVAAPKLHAEPMLVKLDPPALGDDDARARVEAEGARFVRRSVLGWVVVDTRDSAHPGARTVPLKRGFLQAASNDAFLVDGNQWPLEMIGVEDAWAVSKGVGQRVGVVDTGLVRDHPDIVGRDGGGYDFVDDAAAVDGNGADDGEPGRDAEYFDTAPQGALSHGSHVAGVVAATTNNEIGIAGINWDATVISARAVAGSAGGSNFDIMEAALWLAGVDVEGVPSLDAPVDVINMSVGFGGGCDAFAQDIVDEILARGIPIVAAAGNHGDEFGLTDTAVLSPADCNGVIAVGAVDEGAALTAYTNDDGIIDVAAPGGSADSAVVSLGVDGTYVGQMGTSMATPHVSGVVSLMRSVDPSLSPLEIEAMLRALGTTCSGCGEVPLLDAPAALAAAQAGEAEAAGGRRRLRDHSRSARRSRPHPAGARRRSPPISRISPISPMMRTQARVQRAERVTRSCTLRACSRARSS